MRKTLTALMMGALIAGSATAANAAAGMDDMGVKIDSVVAQLGYKWDERPNTDDNFNLNRLRIKITAQPADNIHFTTNLEAADSAAAGGAFGDNTPAGALMTDMGSDSRVVDMYVALTYLDWMTILAGQMPTPVSYELNTDVYAMEPINFSQFVGIANRDRGVGVSIPIPNANTDFMAWILNGTGGINGASDDIDDRNNYGAMLNFKPMEQLGFKVWGNFANMSDDSGLFPGSTAGQLAEWKGDGFGGGVDYKLDNFHLFGEYAQVKTRVTNEVTSARLLSQKTREWYAHGSYKIPETDVQLVLRYDKYDPNTSASNDDTKVTTAGINWDFEKDARVQIMREFNSGATTQDELDIQLSLRF